jgi:hypothetical protein
MTSRRRAQDGEHPGTYIHHEMPLSSHADLWYASKKPKLVSRPTLRVCGYLPTTTLPQEDQSIEVLKPKPRTFETWILKLLSLLPTATATVTN